ncbi:MAG: hypothetical protein IPK82_29455 [Polyangiaceae bacterium]|nr:hypothetical protein [Polyangiaceae bacterium]
MGLTATGSADVLVGGFDDTFEMGAIRAWLLRALPEAIEDFREGILYGTASVLGTLTLPIALGAATRLLTSFGRLLDWISEKLHLPKIWARVFEALGEMIWLAVLLVPDFAVYARWYFRNLWTRLLLGWSAASKKTCPPLDRPVVLPSLSSQAQATADDLRVDNAKWDLIPNNCDVSRGVEWLLGVYRPIFVEWSDDLPAVSLDELLEHAHLEPVGGAPISNKHPRSLEEYIANFPPEPILPATACPPKADVDGVNKQTEKDCYGSSDLDHAKSSNPGFAPPIKDPLLAILAIDEDFARGKSKPPTKNLRTYYGRAIKKHANLIWLEYFALRAGSFLPGPVMDQDVYEHEGDGEGMFVVLRRGGPDQPFLLCGMRFDGEHCKAKCCAASPQAVNDYEARKLAIDSKGGRPIVYIACGSHATSPAPGMRDAGGLTVDFYPSLTDPKATEVANYTLATAAEENVRRALFTKKVTWGKWHLFQTQNYDGKTPILPSYHVTALPSEKAGADGCDEQQEPANPTKASKDEVLPPLNFLKYVPPPQGQVV